MDSKCLLVDTSDKLHHAVHDFDKSKFLSIDTEYDSFRYFREKLCLIQIHANTTTYIFDPLGDLNLFFLGKYFNDERVVKILHAADNDIRLLRRDYEFKFRNIFDTHRAGMLLGFKELSLEKMILHFTGVELKKNKKIQRSRWDIRPLTEEQLTYADEDVVHLVALYKAQFAELKRKGVVEDAGLAFARIADTNWREKKFNRGGYARVSGYESLAEEQKKLFKRLYLWRFHRAKEENRAVFMFLPDKNLLELAQDVLHPEKYLSQRKLKVYGEELERIFKQHSQKNHPA